MKENTVMTDQGIEIYTDRIYQLADEYISTLDNPEDIKGLNKGLFTGMIKYIYQNCFYNNPLDNEDISTLDSIFNIYTSLCYRYNKRPTLLNFSLMVGINPDTFNTWKRGEYRGGLGSLHSETVKKWLAECESALVDGAIEQNGIGCIFALKANYGYTETAPAQIPYSGDSRKSLEQIAAEHGIEQRGPHQIGASEPPKAEF